MISSIHIRSGILWHILELAIMYVVKLAVLKYIFDPDTMVLRVCVFLYNFCQPLEAGVKVFGVSD